MARHIKRLARDYERDGEKSPMVKRRYGRGQVEFQELKTDLASLHRGLCVKLLHLYKIVGKEDLYHASSS
uniref:Uncharacterized protein n=1 Tax=Oryza punctata TaxID=4537 RepID=A0A0E0LT46_ORYPU